MQRDQIFADTIDRLKGILRTNLKKAVYCELGMTESSFSMRQNRGNLPYERIIRFALRNDLSVDYILTGKINMNTKLKEKT